MRKLLLLSAIFMLSTACTNSNNQIPTSVEEASSEIDLQSLEVDPSGEIIPGELELGVTNSSTKEISHKIVIKNSGSSDLALSLSITNDPGFKVKLNRCSAVLLANSKCDITVSFSSRGLYDGNNYTAILNISQQASILLSAGVSGQPDPNTAGSPDLELSLDSLFIPKTSSTYRTLTVINNGSGTARDITAQVTSGYRIRLNRCPQNLLPGKSCYVQITQVNYRTESVAPSGIASINGSNTSVNPSMEISNGGSSVTYVAAFLPPADPNLQVCQGSVELSHTPVCYEEVEGGTIVANSNCTFGAAPTTVFQSPAGNITNSIENGSETFSCIQGGNNQSFVSRSCDQNYLDNNNSCEEAILGRIEYNTVQILPSLSTVVNNAVTSTGAGAALTSGIIAPIGSGSGSTGSGNSIVSSLKTVSYNLATQVGMIFDLPSGTSSSSCSLSSSSGSGSCSVTLASGRTVMTAAKNLYSNFSGWMLNLVSDKGTINKSVNSREYKISQVLNIRSGASDSIISGNALVSFNNRLYMAANNASNQLKIFRLGNSGEAIQISNLNSSGPDVASFSSFAVMNGELYFAGQDSSGTRLFKMNTNEEFVKVSNFNGSFGDGPSSIAATNNEVYFSGSVTFDKELMKADSAGVITRLSNINSASDAVNYITPWNNAVYFVALNSSGMAKLFKLSSGVITQISNTRPGLSDSIYPPIVFNGHLYFPAVDAGGHRNLYRLDSSDQIVKVTNFSLNDDGIISGLAGSMAIFNNRLFFIHINQIVSMGTDGQMMSHYNIGSGNSFRVFNGELFFQSASNKALFKMNSNYEVAQVGKINSSNDFGSILYYAEHNGELYFHAYSNASNHIKLFKLSVTDN